MRTNSPSNQGTHEPGKFWSFLGFFLKSSMWILLRLRYVRQLHDPRRLGNSRVGTLSAQVLHFLDKLDTGDLEFLFFVILDFKCYLLITLFFLD